MICPSRKRGEEKTSWETCPLLEGLCCFGDTWTKGSGRPTLLQERSGPRGPRESNASSRSRVRSLSAVIPTGTLAGVEALHESSARVRLCCVCGAGGCVICGDRGDFEPGGCFCFTKTEKRKRKPRREEVKV